MSNSDSDKEFRVVDKRRFSADGESVVEAAGQKSEPLKTEIGQPPERDPRGAGGVDSRASDRVGAGDPAGQKMDFASLLMSLATQALVLLGELTEGGEGDSRSVSTANLDSARQVIDVLGMLEEKTKGNLTGDEQRLLSEMLTTLRLTYVKKAGK